MSSASSPSWNARVAQAQRDVELLRRRIGRSSRLTVIVGVVVLLLLSGYFLFGYQQLKYLLAPDTLVKVVGGTIDQKLPEARQALEQEIEKSAPMWAEQLSQQAIESIPLARAELEKYALGQTQELVDQLSTMSEDEFRRIIQENRPTIETAFEELAGEERVSQEMLGLLEQALEKELKTEIDDEAHELLGTLLAMTDQLKKLKEGNDLNRADKTLRSMIMIVRRLQMEHRETADLVSALVPAGGEATSPPQEKSALPPTSGGEQQPKDNSASPPPSSTGDPPIPSSGDTPSGDTPEDASAG